MAFGLGLYLWESVILTPASTSSTGSFFFFFFKVRRTTASVHGLPVSFNFTSVPLEVAVIPSLLVLHASHSDVLTAGQANEWEAPSCSVCSLVPFLFICPFPRLCWFYFPLPDQSHPTNLSFAVCFSFNTCAHVRFLGVWQFFVIRWKHNELQVDRISHP